MRKLPRRTYLYFTAQSINLTSAVMSVTMSALVGSALAPTAILSTVPYGFQFLFVMLATYPASQLMSIIGRKKSFMLGSLPLALSGSIGFLAVEKQSFLMLVISHSALGVYIAFANFNRFAATDNVDQTLKPKAISLVVAGGVIAAAVGPTLTEIFRDLGGFALFSLCYASFVGLAALSLLVAICLPQDFVVTKAEQNTKIITAQDKNLYTTPIVIAMAVAALGYGVMNLLMIQASMHMKYRHEHFSDVRLAIQWHVFSMFAPSFFTGNIIQRIGIKNTLCTGLVFLLVCTVINIGANNYTALSLSLILLGLGWNLTYIGGGALLAQALQNNPVAIQMQGRNDLAIAIFATLGAFTPSLLLGTVGWEGTNIICMVLCAIMLVIVYAMLNKKTHSLCSLEQDRK